MQNEIKVMQIQNTDKQFFQQIDSETGLPNRMALKPPHCHSKNRSITIYAYQSLMPSINTV